MNPSDIHILVIDDEAATCLLMARQLQRDGYQVATASNGAEGLEYLERQTVNLIFLDLIMPEMSGYQVLSYLKADPKLAAIAVVMVSSDDDLKNVLRCLEMGADDYILKPINPLLLRIRLHTCLERQWLRQQEQAYLQQLRTERDLAEAATRARSAFLANMSHELRTPLNAVIGYTDILQEEFEAEGYLDYLSDLAKIRGASQHLLSLINDILDISKLESGTMEVNLETFDVRELIEQVRVEMRSPLASSANTLTVDLQFPEGLQMHSDRSKVRQILLNVLGNAVKFTPEGEIRLIAAPEELSMSEPWIVLTIADPGIGIPLEQQRRIFEPFIQVDDSSTRSYGGTGLGLAICHRLSQMLGGSIAVESVVNQGTTVTLRLPTHLTLDEAIASRDARLRSPSFYGKSGSERDPRLVLVIDSDRTVRDWMVQHLNAAGCPVVTSWSGAEGMRLAHDLRPALILMEATLPGLTTWSTLAALKADLNLIDIPVALHVLQAGTSPDSLQGGILGLGHYLTRPDHYPHILTLLAPYAATPGSPSLRTALLVQVDRTTQHMLQRLLSRHQWAVQTATDLPEAIACLRAHPPDAVILNLGTLEDNDLKLWAELQGRSPAIPILYILTHEFTLTDTTEKTAHLYRHLAQHLPALNVAELGDAQALLGALHACIYAYCNPMPSL